MTSFEDSLGGSADYTYYPDGLRRSKTTGGNTYQYYYNGDYVINETKNGSEFATNVFGVDGPISRKFNNYENYYYKNVHGDVIFAFTNGKWRSAEYSYGAYGNEGVSYDAFSDPNPIRYAGEYFDTESGMTYLRARYYDPIQRRFITEDPIKDGMNWYAYCNNNPVMFVDPSGAAAETIIDVAGAIWSLVDFVANPSAINAAFLVWDIASVVLPFIPGSYVTKSGKYIIKAGSNADGIVDSLKTLNNVSRADAIKNGAVTLPHKVLKRLSGNTGLHAHHLIEQRFARTLGIDAGDILSIAIDPDTHKRITKAFRNEIPYAFENAFVGTLNTQTATAQQIWDATVNVYTQEGMTEYLPALKDMMIDAGHNLDWGGW